MTEREMAMDYTQQFKYSVFRIFLFYGVNTLGLMLGKGIYWVAASLVPPSNQGLKQFLISDVTGSVTAALIMVLLLGAVFRDDGKRHAAYEDMDAVLVLITLVLMLGFYFIPAVFFNPYDTTRVMRTVYNMLYFPCRWVTELFGADMKAAAAVGGGTVLAAQFAVYELSYNAYRKKHPNIFLPRPEDDEDDEYSDGEI